ncbi:mechanosensitive ion channel family protein [Halorubellus sp. JP-L1]|uniref:mechanosensitive ion channel family protein n=1 Tax=Halorubellus sp. JP-L1 TaxID=2715753 RepID=UPI00140E431B|nr:mechanosensitive ion channel family protein [Halorubellus sp. JP-L1]NHN40383.1 mechanosensitive ion channel family protein [Halorubellus sp. JP-L1]
MTLSLLDALLESLAGYGLVERTILVLVVSLAAALVLEFVVLRLARRFVKSTGSAFDDIVLAELRWPLVVTAALGGVYVLTQVQTTGPTVVAEDELAAFFQQPVASVIVLVWAYALNSIVNRSVEEVDKTGKYDFAPIFSNVWTLVVLLGAGFLVLTIWGIAITPLLGAAGIAGIAVGFAAKDTVANFFGGLALYFDDTYKIGDYIVLDTGDAGTVVRVGIRSTTLLTRDEVMVTVPNSVLNSASITNESAPQRRRRIRVPLGVAYGTDLDAFEDLAVDVALDESLTLDSPKPRMRLREFGDSALEYELLCWVSTPVKRAKAIHRLNKGLYDAMNDANVEIPFPQRDVHVRPTAAASSAPDSRDSATADAPVADGGDAER